MGLHDYERLSSEIYPLKTTAGKERSFLEVMARNTNWLNSVLPYVSKEDPIINLFNRQVFKATKLREELFFVQCKIYNEDDKINDFTFVVNENTIYKRFRIYKEKNSDQFYNKHELPLNKFIDLMLCYNCKIDLRLFNNESESLKEIFENVNRSYEYYKEWKLKNGLLIEPVGIQHYNKRTWIYLLTEYNVENLDLDYKNPKSDAYYDDNFAKKYN